MGLLISSFFWWSCLVLSSLGRCCSPSFFFEKILLSPFPFDWRYSFPFLLGDCLSPPPFCGAVLLPSFWTADTWFFISFRFVDCLFMRVFFSRVVFLWIFLVLFYACHFYVFPFLFFHYVIIIPLILDFLFSSFVFSFFIPFSHRIFNITIIFISLFIFLFIFSLSLYLENDNELEVRVTYLIKQSRYQSLLVLPELMNVDKSLWPRYLHLHGWVIFFVSKLLLGLLLHRRISRNVWHLVLGLMDLTWLIIGEVAVTSVFSMSRDPAWESCAWKLKYLDVCEFRSKNCIRMFSGNLIFFKLISGSNFGSDTLRSSLHCRLYWHWQHECFKFAAQPFDVSIGITSFSLHKDWDLIS